MPSAIRAYASAWLLTLCVAATPCASIADQPANLPDRLPAHLPVIDAASTLSAPLSVPLSLAPASRTPVLHASVPHGAPAMPGVDPTMTMAPPMACDGPDGRSLGAVVPVATDTGQHASGVIVATGRVLTAAHAIQGAQQVLVRHAADFRPARVLMLDPLLDLAVLAVDTGSIEPLRLVGRDPDEAEPVWAVGFPRARALALSAGVFQQNRDGALHTSAGIDAGQSGGGLLACRQGQYRLAGMLRGYGAYLREGRYEKMANHSVSVAASTIQQFLSAQR